MTLYAGKDLDDAKTISECNIKKKAIVHLILKASEKNLQTYTETQKVCK
jgi:Ubiquitin family